MNKDTIIIGQGISGTWLHYYLQQAGMDAVVIDESIPNSASRAAAGIINPVTGRRIVKTWMIDELLPFVQDAYSGLGRVLGPVLIEQKKIIDFFPTPQMKIAFQDRFHSDPQYLSIPKDENNYRDYFSYDFGYGEIAPCYLVNLSTIISLYRKSLKDQNLLLDEKFELEQLQLSPSGIRYKDIEASRIVFCDGIGSVSNPYFRNLPFAPNKGEALLVEIEGLPKESIYKKGYVLAPQESNLWWLGSTYLWEFDNDQPTAGFRQFAENWLRQTIKLPFRVIQQQAAIRPATLERRPFVGFHPVHKNVGILNGMGTKGCSLAPYFANQLVQHIMGKAQLDPEANIQRFSRILQRN